MKFNKKMLAVGIAISIISTLLVLLFTVDANTFTYLKKINPFWFFLALLVNISAWFIWGFQTKILANTLGSEISFLAATKIITSSLLFTLITPSNIGGEPARIYLLKKSGMKLGDATAVVIEERILGVIFFIILILLAVFLLPEGLLDNNGHVKWLFGLISTLIVLFFFVFIYFLLWTESAKKILFFLVNKITKIIQKEETGRVLIKNLNLTIDDFSKSIKLLLSKNKLILLASFFCTALHWILIFSIPSFLLIGLGQDPIWLISILLQVILTLITMLPITPGGAGIAEIGFVSLYSPFVSLSLIPIIMIGWRVTTFHSAILISGLINLKMLKDKDLI